MKYTDLITREPEYQALLGNVEPDFGTEPDFASSIVEAEADFGADDDDFGGYGFGADMGADVAPAMAASAQAAKMMAHPAHQARAHAIVAKHLHRQHQQDVSKARLNPNAGNPEPTFRWGFSLNATITAIGTAQAVVGTSGAPNIGCFNPDTLTINLPGPGMVYLQDVKVLSQSLLVGGSSDAYKYSAISTSKRLNSVPLNPATPVVVLANYSGVPNSQISSTYTGPFVIDYNFEGWATPAGQA